MRVNMDSSVVSDPRFKLLGKRLGISWRDALGTCFLVWLACYDRRSEKMSPDEIDVAAEVGAFASAMVSVGLAHYSADQKLVIVHGVTARIKFLKQQSVRGRNGGKASGKNRRKSGTDNGIGDEANAEANASGTAQAYSPALALAQSPAPLLPSEEDSRSPDSDPKPKRKPPATPRARDPMFDVIAEVTGSNPHAVGGRIGKVKKALVDRPDPFTVEDVREFARRYPELCPHARDSKTGHVALGDLAGYIDRLRTRPGKADAETDALRRRGAADLADLAGAP